MPTGYTYPIQEDIEFEDFVLSCARAFGACIHQRDDDLKIKPKFREVSPFYVDSHKKATERYEYLSSLNDDQKIEYGNRIQLDEFNKQRRYIEEKKANKIKYENMLEKVKEWNPPTPDHAPLKKFMIEQIQETLRYDFDMTYNEEQIRLVTSKSGMEIYERDLDIIKESIKTYQRRIKEEEERVESSNKWIVELYQSLGVEFE